MNNEKTIKPLFKYIGGKTWLRDKLREKVSYILESQNDITTYVEPFAGGLGAFLSIYDLLSQKGIKKVILSDINFTLINIYKDIKEQSSELEKEILALENGFIKTIPDSMSKLSSKEETKKALVDAEKFFKSVRQDFNREKNTSNIAQSARLIFLQKHSFNGVYRENSKGDYNTPFNWSPNNMIDTISLRISELKSVFDLFDISFQNLSYESLDYEPSSLFYLDPPYANEEIIENKYNKVQFDKKMQLDLIFKVKNLNFIYSNHPVNFIIDELEKIKNIDMEFVSRKNIMSASSESRKDDKSEILACNKV
jgi:DNA adenine methylase